MIRSAVTINMIPEGRNGPFIFRDNLPEGISKAAALGYDAVELFPTHGQMLNRTELTKMLGDAGLSVAAVGSGGGWLQSQLTLTSPDAAVRQKAKDFIRGIIDFASVYSAPVIIGSMQGRTSETIDKEAAIQLLGEALLELGTEAEKAGIFLLYEPLNRYESNLINTLKDGVKLLESLGLSGVKLLGDLFHMNIEERHSAEALRVAAKWLGHVHFADSNRRPMGLGQMDMQPIAAVLHDIHYTGFCSAEAFPWPDPDTAAKQTMTAFRHWFRSEVIV